MATMALLDEIEAYYDGVPRSAARTESIGPFTLFVNRGPGWPYYARPTLGATEFTPEDVARVRRRQQELRIPESFEWVADVSPGVRAAASTAGLAVGDHPLMVLQQTPDAHAGAPTGVTVRIVSPDDDLPRFRAVAAIGFAASGTAMGPEGVESLERHAAERTPEQTAYDRARLREGWTVMAVAFTDGEPVGIGSHQPLGGVSEITGVATLPAFRRRGIAAAVTRLLVADALGRGVRTVFLSAADAEVGRIYEGIGFRRVATACIAEPPDPLSAL
jgi:ribosomal protein S18 acetylase RimI-like enzyme